jgi:hypothetical protein
VLLPTGAEGYESPAVLIAEVQGFTHRYVELPEGYEEIATHYVLFTYVFDRFDELPYLWISNSDLGKGKSRALDAIGSLCYRPMFLGGGSTDAVVRRSVDLYRGTLVSDEQDYSSSKMTSTLAKILNQGFQRGKTVSACDMAGDDFAPQTFEVFGSKILASRKKFQDNALESRCLTIPIRQCTRQDIPLNLDRRKFDVEALALRNKLTMWRFRNWKRTKLNPKLRVPGLEDRLNQIGIPLLSVVADKGVKESIVATLKKSEAALAAARSRSLAGEIVAIIHQRLQAGVNIDLTVAMVTGDLNSRHAIDDGTDVGQLRSPLTGRKVGRIIREELGLQPVRRGGYYHIVLDHDRLSELYKRYLPPETPQESPGSPESPSPGKSYSKSCTQGESQPALTHEQDLQDLLQGSQDIAQDKGLGGETAGSTGEGAQS